MNVINITDEALKDLVHMINLNGQNIIKMEATIEHEVLVMFHHVKHESGETVKLEYRLPFSTTTEE